MGSPAVKKPTSGGDLGGLGEFICIYSEAQTGLSAMKSQISSKFRLKALLFFSPTPDLSFANEPKKPKMGRAGHANATLGWRSLLNPAYGKDGMRIYLGCAADNLSGVER